MFKFLSCCYFVLTAIVITQAIVKVLRDNSRYYLWSRKNKLLITKDGIMTESFKSSLIEVVNKAHIVKIRDFQLYSELDNYIIGVLNSNIIKFIKSSITPYEAQIKLLDEYDSSKRNIVYIDRQISESSLEAICDGLDTNDCIVLADRVYLSENTVVGTLKDKTIYRLDIHLDVKCKNVASIELYDTSAYYYESKRKTIV